MEFIKTLALPCLVLSLLQLTGTLITIIVQFEISFSIKIHVKWLSFDQSFLYSNLILVLPALIFSNKNHDLQKKKLQKKSFFTVDFVKIIESHIVHTWLHVQSE